MNEKKLAIYKSGSWLERSSLTKSILILNMLTESVDLTLVTFSNDDDDNNNFKKNWFYEKNNCSARASRFLVHFFDVHCTITT